jgi:hypothetical protein
MDNFDPNAFAGFGIVAIIIGVIVYVGILLLMILIFWAIIRSAVRRALRDHQEWLDLRHVRPPQ